MEDMMEAPQSEETPSERDWYGLTIVIECLKGENRDMGRFGSMAMSCDYGYIKGTTSMEEGDSLDVFMNTEPLEETAESVFIVGMLAPDGGLEEEKAFLDFDCVEDAQHCFDCHYTDKRRAYTYQIGIQDFLKLIATRAPEYALSDSNPDIETEGLDDEDHSEKSLRREPIHRLGLGMKSNQLRKVIESRRLMRDRAS